MTITRRGLLAGILGACAAPAIIHNPMRLWVPRPVHWLNTGVWNDALLEKKFAAFCGGHGDYWGVDPGFPGGDQTAYMRWQADRGYFQIVAVDSKNAALGEKMDRLFKASLTGHT